MLAAVAVVLFGVVCVETTYIVVVQKIARAMKRAESQSDSVTVMSRSEFEDYIRKQGGGSTAKPVTSGGKSSVNSPTAYL